MTPTDEACERLRYIAETATHLLLGLKGRLNKEQTDAIREMKNVAFDAIELLQPPPKL